MDKFKKNAKLSKQQSTHRYQGQQRQQHVFDSQCAMDVQPIHVKRKLSTEVLGDCALFPLPSRDPTDLPYSRAHSIPKLSLPYMARCGKYRTLFSLDCCHLSLLPSYNTSPHFSSTIRTYSFPKFLSLVVSFTISFMRYFFIDDCLLILI